MEKQLIDTANSLFVDIDSCIQSCENDVKTTFIPMSSSEANMMLDKQNQIMGALKDEIVEYQKRSEELSSKIAQLEAKRESLGESPEPENAVQSPQEPAVAVQSEAHPDTHGGHHGHADGQRHGEGVLQEPV